MGRIVADLSLAIRAVARRYFSSSPLYLPLGRSTAGRDTPDSAPYVRALLHAQPRPVPGKFALSVTDEADHRYILAVDALDGAQTQAAFARLHAAHPAAPLTPHVETTKYAKASKLELAAEGQRVPLTKCTVRMVT